MSERDEQSKRERIEAKKDLLDERLDGYDDLLEHAAKLEISLFQDEALLADNYGTFEDYLKLQKANREGKLLEFSIGDYDPEVERE